MAKQARSGPASGSVMPATAALNKLLAAAPGPRMLTDHELSLLRRSAQEIAARLEHHRV